MSSTQRTNHKYNICWDDAGFPNLTSKIVILIVSFNKTHPVHTVRAKINLFLISSKFAVVQNRI